MRRTCTNHRQGSSAGPYTTSLQIYMQPDPEQPELSTMRSTIASHGLPEDAYTSLQHELESATSSYPPFSSSIHHHGDSIPDRNSSGFSVSSPEHHGLHTHIEHSGLHLDPHLSPGSGRHGIIPGSSTTSHEHAFGELPAPSNSKDASPPPPIPANTAPPCHFDMLPPSASTHPSWQALHTYAQSHASAHGYALSINTTAKNRSRIKLACVCYGAPKNTHKLTPETRIRKNRVSYKTGCKMWVEGKKTEQGLWVLRVGEPAHNHEGRPSEGWAVQRKRTWGVQGGRVGVGGVTAQEEREQQQQQKRGEIIDQGKPNQNDAARPHVASDSHTASEEISSHGTSHSLESGGLVWKIVEQEMLRKGVPGQLRDRGVGRTIVILEERLPGIRIFKRDIYNIRAQIKKARHAAGQQIGETLSLSDNDEEYPRENAEGSPYEHPPSHTPSHAEQGLEGGRPGNEERGEFSRIDPSLIAQCNSALENAPPAEGEDSQLEMLRREVGSLRHALELKTKEVEQKDAENESLRVQLELVNMALYNGRGSGSGQ